MRKYVYVLSDQYWVVWAQLDCGWNSHPPPGPGGIWQHWSFHWRLLHAGGCKISCLYKPPQLHEMPIASPLLCALKIKRFNDTHMLLKMPFGCTKHKHLVFQTSSFNENDSKYKGKKNNLVEYIIINNMTKKCCDCFYPCRQPSGLHGDPACQRHWCLHLLRARASPSNSKRKK